MIVTQEDKELALQVANEMERVYVRKGQTRLNIADAIAKGIALGRQKGFELATQEMAATLERMRSGGSGAQT